MRLGSLVARLARGDPEAHEVQHLSFERLVSAPEWQVRHGVHAFPARGLGEMPRPAMADVAIEEFAPLGSEKCGHVYAVGHVRHGILGRLYAGPERRADARRH